MNDHFIILGLPRSMTAWVSCFLTCGDVFCQHELSERYEPNDIFLSLLQQPFPVSGICDSGLLAHWRYARDGIPTARFVVIIREADEVRKSLEGIGLSEAAATTIVKNMEVELDSFLDSKPFPMCINYDDLQTEEGATRLWNYVAPFVPLPPEHLSKMMSLKVTVHPKVYSETAKTLNKLTEGQLAYAGMRALTG